MTTYKEAVNDLKRGRKIDRRRIPSNKERIRKVGGKGFDDSYIDKKHLDAINDTHVCFWCKEKLTAITDFVAKQGRIIMTCDTDECPGNYSEKRSSYPRPIKKLFGRIIDKKLCFDLATLLIGRDNSRLWATRKRTI